MAAGAMDTMLRGLLQGYAHPDAARTDLSNALLNYRDLKPLKKDFVFNDGTLKNLLCLDGTIPITYKGNTYNIPVVIWLLEQHPYTAPMVFVVPTSTMSIRPGRAVDVNGTVRLQYLSDWRHPPAETLSLLQVLAQAFSEAPPVFSKSSARPPPPAALPYPPGPGATPAAAAQPPGLSYPAAGGGTGSPLPPGQLPYPAYPGQPQTTVGGQMRPPPPGPSYPMGGATMPTPGVYQQPPMHPMLPGQGAVGGYPGSGYPGSGYPGPTGYPPGPPAGAGVPPYGQPAPYPPQAQGPYGGMPQPAPAGYPPYAGARLPYPPAVGTTAAMPSSGVAGYPNAAGPSSSQYLSDEQVKLSLRTAVEDKIRRKLRERFAQFSAEMEVLRKVQEELNGGQQRLTTMIQAIANEQKEVEKTKKFLLDKVEEMKSASTKLDSRDEMDAEDVVVPTAPLYKQLLGAFAEEQAIEDVLYCLGEGLRKNLIDLDVYMKKVRELSRRQFLLRALMQKCREKAGLSDVYG